MHLKHESLRVKKLTPGVNVEVAARRAYVLQDVATIANEGKYTIGGISHSIDYLNRTHGDNVIVRNIFSEQNGVHQGTNTKVLFMWDSQGKQIRVDAHYQSLVRAMYAYASIQ